MYEYDYILINGEQVDGKKISEFVQSIINKFAEEKLSIGEAEVILDQTKERLQKHAIVQKIKDF